MGKAQKIKKNIAAKRAKITDISRLKDDRVYTTEHKGYRIQTTGRALKDIENKIKNAKV